MLLPYRVKNPPKKFPIATVSLIAINVLVYLFTTDYFLVIREDILKNYAFAMGASPLINSIFAMFLHGDIFHLLGNMLFLWVFGPSVEDRLKIPWYLVVYFMTGCFGDLLQAMLDGMFFGLSLPGIGASGCIMGVVGAYWYLFSWSTVCVFYWIFWFWHGVWEVAAIWIIGLFVAMDLFEGLLSGSAGIAGGVANFAHIGGGVAGILMCMAMGMKRDTEEISQARALHSDLKDLSMVPVDSLEAMIEADPENLELVRALVNSALSSRKMDAIGPVMARVGVDLVEKDPSLVAMYLLDLHGDASIYSAAHLLRLAGLLEKSNSSTTALNIYKLISQTYPTNIAAETALYRMAECHWKKFRDAQGAQSCLNELAKRFPDGQMLLFGKQLWSRILSETGTPPVKK